MRAVALIALLLAGAAYAFTVRPYGVSIVGRGAKGAYFWKPSSAVVLDGTSTGALKIVTSAHECEYTGNCDFRVAYTTNAGESFQIADSGDHKQFCGSAGVVRGGKLYCVGNEVAETDDEVLTFEEVEYSISPANGISSGPATKKARITFESRKPFKTQPIVKLRFGERTLALDDRSTHLRNAEVTLKNGSTAHGLYKSVDNGKSWQWVSQVPIPFGPFNSIMRVGDTKIMLLSGLAPGLINSTQSVYLGTRWEKVERAPFHMLPEIFMSPYNVAVYTGVRGRPGLHMYATSSKKGSERPIDLMDFHNRISTKKNVDGANNFSQAFIGTPNFDCLDPNTLAPRKDVDDHETAGCASSSYTTTMSFGNNSFVAFYDQLQGGYHASADADDHTVYAMKLSVNDTKEQQDYEDRLKEEQKRKEQEKVYEEQREQARKERQEKKRKDKREKQRKNQEKRKLFEVRDQPYVEEAQRYYASTGEWAVVRDVDPEWTEFERAL